MRTLRMTGATGLLCAMITAACADSSPSLLPTSPSAVSASSSNTLAATVQSGTMASVVVAGDVNSVLGHGNGNGNGGGNPNANGGSNGNGNGGGNGNGNGNGNQPPAVQTPAPPSSKKVELEGLISAVAGNVLTVNGQEVVVPATVVVHHGSHVVDFSDLAVGDRVHVRAEWLNGVLTASDVKLQNPGDEEESGDPTDGTALTVADFVSSLSLGACPNKTFNVGTQPVLTNASTVFIGGPCSAINNFGYVQVVGVLQSGVLVAAQVLIN
jgi:hypothetical protein